MDVCDTFTVPFGISKQITCEIVTVCSKKSMDLIGIIKRKMHLYIITRIEYGTCQLKESAKD